MSISFNPNAPAKSTDTLHVEMVRRVSNGEIIDVSAWLPTQTEEEIHFLRTKIRQENGERFSCFCCGHDVLLRKHEHGGHYFAHKEKNAAEKAKCLYQQKGIISLEERNRIRYHGQREGSRHIKTKQLIKKILCSDPGFSQPEIEKTWTTFADGWRKPDVASKWNGQPIQQIVFEAQVSNTYPQVVAERTDFYRKQGALLIWIYDRLTEKEWRTLHADTFCSNGRHLFIVDEECVTISEAKGQAHFRIYSQRPEVVPFKRPTDNRWGLEIIQKENFDLIPFSSLSLNVDSQTANYFDIHDDQRIVKHKVLCAEVQSGCSYDALEKSIQEFIKNNRPIDRKQIEGWAALICGIESKRLGEPIGTKLANAVGVLNLVYDHHPNFFPHLIHTLDRLKIDPPDQRCGAWKKRVNDFYRGVYKGDPLPQPHKKSSELLTYLYS